MKILKGSRIFTSRNQKQVVCWIVSFCQKNGIVYSQFERWYKNRYNVKVHAVNIVDKDGAYKVQNTSTESCVVDKPIPESE